MSKLQIKEINYRKYKPTDDGVLPSLTVKFKTLLPQYLDLLIGMRYDFQNKMNVLIKQYINDWIKLIDKILVHYKEKINEKYICDFGDTSILMLNYQNCKDVIFQRYNLKPDSGKSVMYWGTMEWIFLHTISILLYFMNEESYTKLFANLLLSFDLCLPCAKCTYNYKHHNILDEVIKPIYEGEDVIYIIYKMHNLVNADIPDHIHQFPFDKFLTNYKLQLT